MNYPYERNVKLPWRIVWAMKLMEQAITLAEREKFLAANRLAEPADKLIEKESRIILADLKPGLLIDEYV